MFDNADKPEPSISPATADALSPAAAGATPRSPGNGNPVSVDLDLVVQHPRAVRLANQDDVIAGLVVQMKSTGFFEKRFAVTARRRADGKLEVISGWHRVEAARLAGVKVIWAFLVEMTDREAYTAAALANTQEPLSKLEIALFAITVVEEDKTESIASLARKLGLQRENLTRAMKGGRVLNAVRNTLTADEIVRLRDKAEHLARIADASKDKWAGLIKQFLAAEAQDATLAWTIRATDAVVEALNAPPSEAAPLDTTDGPSVGPPERDSSCQKNERKTPPKKGQVSKETAHGKNGAVEVSLAVGGEPTKLPIDGKLVRVRVTKIEIPREVLERALKESASNGASEVNGIPTVSVDAHLLHRIPTITSGTVKLEVL
jgi:ParB/RepB/Spo0J family partition protein